MFGLLTTLNKCCCIKIFIFSGNEWEWNHGNERSIQQ